MMKVSEVFGPTIQGEGRSVGREVVFLRLSGCNLHCVWCDTPYTWNWIGTDFAHPDKYDPELEVEEMNTEQVYEAIAIKAEGRVKSLVVSGGEPLIQHKQLLPLLQWLKNEGWWIEIETNGTFCPPDEFCAVVDQFNCSPKLSNSGDPFKLRVRERALTALALKANVYFKFVIISPQDAGEVLEMVQRFDMKRDHIFLMPEGKTPDQLEKTRGDTERLAAKLGVLFSDRLHVTMFGGVRGV